MRSFQFNALLCRWLQRVYCCTKIKFDVGRGEGFSFSETIVGGVVPRQYISGVKMGIHEFLQHGVRGFPIVDIDVTPYHSVDSSEQAFKQAARIVRN